MDEETFRRLLEVSSEETRRQFTAAIERLEASGAETRRHADDAAAALRIQIEETTVETRRQADDAAAALRIQIEETTGETRRHFDVSVERLENKIQLVAESVAQLDEKYERRTDDLEDRMDRGFAETQAMIRFSHAELDRRVRALENGLAELQARVERLETAPH